MHDETGTERPVVRQRSKPTLVQIGNRVTTSDGRFHPELCGDFCLDHAREKWVTVGDLCKVFSGTRTLDGKRKVRRNLFRVFTYLLGKGEFLLYHAPAPRHKIQAVKLLNLCVESERESIGPQLERMRRSHQLSAAKYDSAVAVLENKRARLHLPTDGDA